MRILKAALVMLALSLGTAHAGDVAALETIGFSADGKVFAFEQYGIEDGSGFAYSQIVFVDLDADAFVAPSPVTVRVEDDGALLSEARRRARDGAKALFETHGPERHPGLAVADNPVTELSADPSRMVFLPRPVEPSPDAPVELRLERIAFPETGACIGVSGGMVAGFRLTRIGTAPASAAKLLHEDASVPASRHCPTDYRLSRVVVFEDGAAPRRAVVLVGVKSVGFEGPNLRFIAVPLPLG